MLDMVGEADKVYPMFLVSIASPADSHALRCFRVR